METKPIFQALDHVWRVLAPFEVPMTVVGGINLLVWDHLRTTLDIDLLIGVSPVEADKMVVALQQSGMQFKHESGIRRLEDMHLVQLLYTSDDSFLDIQVDLLLSQSKYHQQALDRSVSAEFPGVGQPVRALSCEDLIIHKLAAGRMRDRADAAALLSANHTTIDREYLKRWVTKLELQQLWDEVCREALPDHSEGNH